MPELVEAERLTIRGWAAADDRKRLLQVIQPGLVGLIDGTVSTLAPIFATAYLAGESFPDRPAFGTAVSRAILLRVAAGELPETIRLGRPGRSVAFGRQDRA